MAFKNNEWKPNPKQAQFLAVPMSVKEAGYLGGAGSGKALWINEKIPTIDGLKKISDVHVGDVVFNPHGIPVSVIGESEIFTNNDCYKLTFDSGFSLIADAAHEWVVQDSHKRNYKLVNTEQIFSTTNKKRTEYSIDVSDAYFGSSAEYPIDPYTLGVWLGDGNSHTGSITSIDKEILAVICSNGYEVREYGYNYQWRIFGLERQLKNCNLIRNKHIPELYYFLTSYIRLELLRGLMDTDGSCNKTGNCEISLSDFRLAHDTLRLIRSLGIKASVSENKSTLYGVEHKNRFRIKFSTKTIVFNLSRKQNLQVACKQRLTNERHYIISCERVDSVPTKCIQVFGELYQATEHCVITHNSDVLLAYALIHGWYKNPKFKQVFMRRTFPELRTEIVPRSREFYEPFGAKLNKSEMSWSFPREDQYGSGMPPTGAMIFLGHCENEDDVHKYDSMEINLFTPDEITTYTEWIYTYITFQRCRTSDASLPAIARAAGMPGGIGHTWVKKRFVDPYPKGGKILIGRGGNKRIFIHATLADNTNIDPNYAQSLDALPEAERNAKKFGNWDSYLGQVFDEFRDRKHVDEPENALHVIEPFDKEDRLDFGIPAWWPRIISMDWGYRPPAATVILYGAISPERRLYIYREDVFQSEKIEVWCSKVKHVIDEINPITIKLCKSAGQNRGQEHTIYQQICSALNRTNIELTDNTSGTRVAGKMLLHEYLRWRPKYSHKAEANPYNPDFADWLLRNKTEEDHKLYLQSFQPVKEENNLPKLLIFNNCTNLIDSIRACVYAKNNPQDVAEFPGDDAYDAVRYLVDEADRYFEDSEGAMKKLQRQDDLNRITDMSTYYRNARRIELEEEVPMAVARFHRRRN